MTGSLLLVLLEILGYLEEALRRDNSSGSLVAEVNYVNKTSMVK